MGTVGFAHGVSPQKVFYPLLKSFQPEVTAETKDFLGDLLLVASTTRRFIRFGASKYPPEAISQVSFRHTTRRPFFEVTFGRSKRSRENKGQAPANLRFPQSTHSIGPDGVY